MYKDSTYQRELVCISAELSIGNEDTGVVV